MVIVVIDCIHLSSIIFFRRGFNLVPNNAGSYIYIYKRHRSLFKAKRRKKSRTKRESLFAKRSSARLLRNETPKKKRGKFVWRRNEKEEKNCLIVRLIEETSSQIESS